MIAPAIHVRALVSGYPAEVRNRALLMMVGELYQANIDDSGNHAAAHAFILAGFLAKVEQWERFSTEWRDALDHAGPRRIENFKMRDAAAFAGEFRGWTERDRDDLLRALISIIETRAATGIFVIVPHKEYREIFCHQISKAMDNPYFFSFYGIMSVAQYYMYQQNKQNEINFVFDEQGRQVGNALRAWKYWTRFAIPQMQPMLGERPQSGNDKKLLPLQAADLLAWRTYRLVEDGHSHESLAYRLLPMSMNIEGQHHNRQSLQNMFDRMSRLRRETGRPFLYELSRKDRRRAEKLMAKGR
jgi:hypothetical protein